MSHTSNREAKSFTKECVVQAFLQLLKEKEYQKITVSEIAKKSGVSRNAIYRNFKSKEMILKIYLTDLTVEYMENHSSSEIGSYEAHIEHLFGYLCDNADLSEIIIKAGMGSVILDTFSLVRGYTSSSFTQKHYYESYRMGGVFAVYLTWLSNGRKETKKELAEIVCNMVAERGYIPDFNRKDC